jgi:hypothetical protein
MTVQEVMLKAFSGEIHWFRAADILGWPPRTLRRWRESATSSRGMSASWINGGKPRRSFASAPEIARLLRLYRERYRGFNVRHLHQPAQREHADREPSRGL